MGIVDIIVLSLVLILVIAYFILMVFYPEWVGITGKSAQKILKEHEQGSQSSDPDFYEESKSNLNKVSKE